jgi:sulfur carrier protein
MNIKLNGKIKEVEDSCNLQKLLQTLNVNIDYLAVELNGNIVESDSYEQTELKEGDKLEIVSFVGGG